MEEKLTIKQVGIRYGIYLALVSIIYSVILQITGQAANRNLGYVSIIFTIVALVMAHRDFKKSNEFMDFGEGFKISLIILSISVVVSVIFSYIYIKFIDNSMLEVMRQQTEAQLEKRGLSDAQVQAAMEMQAKFTTPEMILVFGIVFGFIFGLIIALIVTAITKKNRPEIPA